MRINGDGKGGMEWEWRNGSEGIRNGEERGWESRNGVGKRGMEMNGVGKGGMGMEE